jgi:hypothetical protein
MNIKKHKKRWEGIHHLRVKHEIYDTGNPLTGLNDSPVPRIGPRPLIAEFSTAAANIKLHAAYCDDKHYEGPESLRVDVWPNQFKIVKIPRVLTVPEIDKLDPLAKDYPFTDLELTFVCGQAKIELDGGAIGVPDFVRVQGGNLEIRPTW